MIAHLERPFALELLKAACFHGSKLAIQHLIAHVQPSLEESVELVSKALQGGKKELAKNLLQGQLRENPENTIGLACLLGHSPTINFVLAAYRRTAHTIFELLVETVLNSSDCSYYLALENLLMACPYAGSDFHGQPFFFAAMKHGKYQLADILFRACEVDLTYLEPFIVSENVYLAGRFLAVLLDEAVKLRSALFMAVKSNCTRSFVALMEWAMVNKSAILTERFVAKIVLMLGRKLESDPITAKWIEFFQALLGFGQLTLCELEQIVAKAKYERMAAAMGLLKVYSALLQMKAGDYWLPRELVQQFISSLLTALLNTS
jgi:hypothetical protein